MNTNSPTPMVLNPEGGNILLVECGSERVRFTPTEAMTDGGMDMDNAAARVSAAFRAQSARIAELEAALRTVLDTAPRLTTVPSNQDAWTNALNAAARALLGGGK